MDGSEHFRWSSAGGDNGGWGDQVYAVDVEGAKYDFEEAVS